MRPETRKRSLLVVVLAIAAATLVACQPEPEERFARANDYMANAEYRSAVIELKNILQVRPDDLPARQMLARATFILNELPEAESEYRKILAQTGGDAETWAGYGRSLLQQGKTTEALAVAVEDLAGYEDSDAAATLLGDIYRAVGNLDLAAEAYDRAIDIDADNDRALAGAALLAAAGGNMPLATRRLDAAIERLPQSTYLLSAKGDVHALMQDYATAADAYARSIAAESITTPFGERIITRQNSIAALVEARRLDDAAAALDDFSQLFPNHPRRSYFAGRIAFARGDYALAEDALLRYLADVPSDPHGQAILGAINFSKDNLGQAEQYLSNAVRANVGGETTRVLLAETQLRLNRPGDAMQSLRTANDADNAITLAMLGRAKVGAGDTQAAIDYFERSLEQTGSNRAINLALASSLVTAGRLDEAAELLADMTPLEEAGFHRETLLMGIYVQQDKVAEAEAIARSLLGDFPDSAEAHAIAGVLYANLDQSRRAEAQLNTALGIDPAHPGALYAMGMLEKSAGDPAAAAERFDTVLDSNAAHLPALIQLASLAEEQGRLAGIRPRLAGALASTPDSPGLLKLNARIELLLGDASAAAASIDRGREIYPEDSDFVYLDGIRRLLSRDAESAVSALRLATEAEPDNPSYVLDLAKAHLANRDFASAIGVARHYRKLRPDDVRGLAIEVDAQIRSGDPAEAGRSVSAYASQHPDEPFIAMLRGDIARASGDAARAVEFYSTYAAETWNRDIALRLAQAQYAAGSADSVKTFERWLDGAPDDAVMRRVYAQLLEARGDSERAIRQYEYLARNDDLDAIGLNNLAWQYSMAGRDGAMSLAERAHALSPEDGNIADTLGWILYREGQFARAAEVLRRAAEQETSNPEIRYHLAAALAKIGERDEARDIVRELLASTDPFPSRAAAEALSVSL